MPVLTLLLLTFLPFTPLSCAKSYQRPVERPTAQQPNSPPLRSPLHFVNFSSTLFLSSRLFISPLGSLWGQRAPTQNSEEPLIGSCLSESLALRIRAWLEKAGGKVGWWDGSHGNGSNRLRVIPSLRDRWTLWRRDFGEGRRGRPMATFW